MVERIEDMPAGTIGFRASGKLTPEDYREVLVPTLRGAVDSGEVRMLFVLSDFVPAPSNEVWFTAIEQRWDVVPVVIQDPTWEQSFPDVSGIVVPLRDADSGRTIPVRLKRRETDKRGSENEDRVRNLLTQFQELDLDPILISSSDPSEILAAFLAWAELRRVRRVVQA